MRIACRDIYVAQELKRERAMDIERGRCSNFTTPAAGRRRGSVLTRRASLFNIFQPSECGQQQDFHFLQELRSVCGPAPQIGCQVPCMGRRERSQAEHSPPAEEEEEAREEEAEEEDRTEEKQFQLYMKEVRRLNPSLKSGCLFVDGVYELVCSRLPVDIRSESSPITGSARDLFSGHSSGSLLLQKYWNVPDDLTDHGHYLAVALSVAEFVLSSFGARGVAQFLQELDCNHTDPQAVGFKFRGYDILSLEFKWRKFVEAQVNETYRLTVLGLLRLLLLKYLLPFWPHLCVILLLVLVEVGIRIVFAIVVSKLFAIGFTSGDLVLIFQWTGVQVGVLLLHFAFMQVSIALQATVAVRVSNQLRRQISQRLHSVSAKFFTDHSAGGVLSSFVEDVNAVETLLSHGLRTIAFGLLMLTAHLVLALVVAWPVGIPLAVVFVGGQLLLSILASRLSNHSFARMQATNKLTDILKEQIDGYAVNRLYGLGEFWQQKMKGTLASQYTPKARRSVFLTQFIFLVQFAAPAGVSAFLILGVVLLAHSGRLDFERALPVITLFHSVKVAVAATSALVPLLQSASTAMGRIRALLHNPTHTLEDFGPPNSKQLPHSLPIEFKHVSFSYKPTAGHWNLYDVNLSISAGERVAVVGPSGCGKSTFLGLILGTLEPVHGAVVIGDGERERQMVAATFQQNHIFNMSILENIRVGHLTASDEEVKEAAQKADIHSWVSTLPRGYNTVLQSGGSSLSGGQRQRIAIARMLVGGAPVIVLDEVTSTLDRSTEGRVFEQLMEVTEGRTVVCVTHHLSQVPSFDRVIVLSHGKVVEDGTHLQLLGQRGVYWQLWNSKTTLSTGAQVPIIRRRGSLPNISILPCSAEFTTPAVFTPLCLVEESYNTTTADSSSHSVSCSPPAARSLAAVSADSPGTVTVLSETPLPRGAATSMASFHSY